MWKFYENEDPDKVHPFIFKKRFKKMSHNFNGERLKNIKEEEYSKLKTYSPFKSDVGLEQYFLDIKKL